MNEITMNESDKSVYNGTRKLVRPRLPEGWDRRSGRDRRNLVSAEEALTHPVSLDSHSVQSSHAEAFYFQKQIQFQTEMTVVLDDGDRISGVIEWYDSSVIKVRSGRRRVLIYKSAIKYLYKTSEQAASPLQQRSAVSAD
jgi:sRNA-binding regulator protein Hfq